jgi:hypothetical protein
MVTGVQTCALPISSIAVLLSIIIFVLTQIQLRFEPGRRGGGE